MDEKIKAIITGATGMVGEGVLHECLQHPLVESVLVINRKPCGVVHPKLKEIIHNDFFDLSSIENLLGGCNACFFCLGVTSIGKNEEDYYKLTYTLTMNFARTLSARNSGMTFCYVSGAGTDSSEKGKSMWARIKGKTENDLMKLPFKQVYAFRPGYIHPTKELKNAHSVYKYISRMYPIIKALFPNYVCTLKQLSLTMINSVSTNYKKNILESRDIVSLSGIK